MQLKDYQAGALETLSSYLSILEEQRGKTEAARAALEAAGQDIALPDPVVAAWDEARKRGVAAVDKAWVPLKDGLGAEIPHLCLKLPTGGGKTFLAAQSAERIWNDHFNQRTGLILWVVPSEAIYRQTFEQLRNREHPYRQVLDRASGGRVKLLEKLDRFTPQDLEERLCVMLLMLQSSARQSKDQLKLFKDNGGYTSFFPREDDYAGMNALLQTVPNLDRHDLADATGPLKNIQVKTSLGNVLRQARPVIVLDEGHRAYSQTARETLAGFNPRFMLELTATPKAEHSNILVNVSGLALKREEMIKLPIELSDFAHSDWKRVLGEAWKKIETLKDAAVAFESQSGRYIRPILLVRVDRTGKEQRGKGGVHAEDARDYLLQQCGLREDAVRVKSAEMDEIAGEALLAEGNPVRVIITKDALKEGWDCPFAYCLALLSETRAETALTQMIGRILRQPHAERTGVEALDKSYVFCGLEDVREAVGRIRKGLENEGMGDLIGEVTVPGKEAQGVKPVTVRRRPAFRGRKILVPRVLHTDGPRNWRPIDYERDILGCLDWEAFEYRKAESVTLDALEAEMRHTFVMDTGTRNFELTPRKTDEEILAGTGLDRIFLIRQLTGIIPNPWQAARILDAALKTLRDREIGDDEIMTSRLALTDHMKADLREQIDAAAEALFREKVEDGRIVFRLTGDERHDYEVREIINTHVANIDEPLFRTSGDPLERSLFETIYEKGLNAFEQKAALYFDESDAVKWWHRVAERQDWGLQGWRKHKVYPDFLVWLEVDDDRARLLAIETKGEHLDNKDTEWKRRLFAVLERAYADGRAAGSVELFSEAPEEMDFTILFQNKDDPEAWRAEAGRVLASGNGGGVASSG